MRRVILTVLSLAMVSGAGLSAADKLPNPFARAADLRPAFIVIGNTAARKEGPIFDVVDVETVAVSGNEPVTDLFTKAVTRELRRDTILLTAKTTALIFLDANKKPLAAFLYRSRARLNKKVLEPIAITQNGGGYTYRLLSELVGKMQGVSLETASREERIAATSLRFIPVGDIVDHYAGVDVADAFPRSLLCSPAK